MGDEPIYLDNQSTTRVDPQVVEAMLPYFGTIYGNAASITHQMGHDARDAVENSRRVIAESINAHPDEIVFTSGATESNNLAIKGTTLHTRNKKKRAVTLTSEHKAVLDPMSRIRNLGIEVETLSVADMTGSLDLSKLDDFLDEQTLLASVMLANNEIGTIHPIAEIGKICQSNNVLLHCDAAQALGKISIDVKQMKIDLMSITAHKIYGPKGIGAVYIRNGMPRIRLTSQMDGGGHEKNRRSGTLNVPLIVGFAKAVQIAMANQEAEQLRVRGLRDDLFSKIQNGVDGVTLNGPPLSDSPDTNRLAGNLNCQFDRVDGQSLAMQMTDLSVSTGSACTSENPEPSHVLMAIGLNEDQARCSIRFGIGRFNNSQEIDRAADIVCTAVKKLRNLGG